MDSDHGENRRTSIPRFDRAVLLDRCRVPPRWSGSESGDRRMCHWRSRPRLHKHVRAGYGGRWSRSVVCAGFAVGSWRAAEARRDGEGGQKGGCLIMPLSVPQEMTISLNWGKCEGNVWCSFSSLNLAHPNFHGLEGVYIIWHGGPNPWTVYVGQGNVKDRLTAHRGDQQILQYSPHGLFATWAAVDRNSRSGIERYLADTLNPRVGHSHPHVVPVPVTLPW
jgi:hypothetical protein